MKFSDLDLKPEIQKGLQKLGYSDLTPIQEITFPHIISGRDIIALAETGSGKTSACGVPVLERVEPHENVVQALVMVPTRELALQYVGAMSDIAKFTNISCFAVYGGFSIETQKAKLLHGVQVLIATPGRLIDLLYNSPLNLSQVRTLILDEADEMLNMGFITDIEFIISCLVHEHQTLLFSATMPKEIKHLARKYLKDPELLELNVEQVAPESLRHEFLQVSGRRKFEALLDYLREKKPTQTILFCNSRRNCENLFKHLGDEVKNIEMIHGGMEQSRRSVIFNKFKKKQTDIIVATDIAGRGLDFSHVSHVINYDFPGSPQAYTHRTGRTARMGREGTALTFFGGHDVRSVGAIIRENRITPVWLGEEPDFGRPGGGGGGGPRRGGPQGKRRGGRGRRRGSGGRGRSHSSSG